MGASWVRNAILEKHPDAAISVYAVWVPQLGATRGDIDAGLFGDKRVRVYWDPNELAGLAIAPDVEAFEYTPWDAYTLYGPDARWEDGPPQPVDWATPVISATDRLDQSLEGLLKG